MHTVMPTPIAEGAKIPPPAPVNQDTPPDIPTGADAHADADDSKASPLHFDPAEPFESKDEAEVPSASIILLKPHHTDRGMGAAITYARKKKYYGKKKESNLVLRQACWFAMKQIVGTGKRVFMETKIVKYRVDVELLGYEVIKLYQSNKFWFYGTVLGKPPNSKLYKEQLDLMPSDCTEILVVRTDITVLANGEEEPAYDPWHDAMIEECQVAETPSTKKSSTYIGKSYEQFHSWDQRQA